VIGIQEKRGEGKKLRTPENKENSWKERLVLLRENSTKQRECVKGTEREKETYRRRGDEKIKSIRDNKGCWAMRFVLPGRE